MLKIPIWKNAECDKNLVAHLPFSLLLFILFTFQSKLQSQPIYAPGLVITTQGDTLRGEIGEFGGNKNYQECLFRAAGSKNSQRFSPAEIRGYLIENRRFFEARSLSKDSVKVFMEWIIRGSLSLVRIKKDFYLLHPADTLQQVPLRQTTPTRNKEDYQLMRRNWLFFLNPLTKDCVGLKYHFGNPDNLKQNEENLIEIIKLYNDCKETPYVEYGVGLPFLAADLGVSVAIDYTRLEFSSTLRNTYSLLTKPDFTTLGPALGIGILLRSPRRLSTFGVYIEPSIRSYRVTGDLRSDETQNSADEAYYHTEINWLGLGSPVAIRYTIPNIKPNLSFQAGPFVQLLFQTKAETLEELVVEEFLQERKIVTTNSYAPFEFSDFQLGFAGQVNLRQQWDKLPGRWEFALGFQRGGGIALEDTQGVFGLLESSTTSFFVKTVWLW
jgi:hypothetical protein